MMNPDMHCTGGNEGNEGGLHSGVARSFCPRSDEVGVNVQAEARRYVPSLTRPFFANFITFCKLSSGISG